MYNTFVQVASQLEVRTLGTNYSFANLPQAAIEGRFSTPKQS